MSSRPATNSGAADSPAAPRTPTAATTPPPIARRGHSDLSTCCRISSSPATPWYHRNVDYDEIAFFHGGSVYGIPMPPGLITHAPQGVHHGAPERARERARRKFDDYDKVD